MKKVELSTVFDLIKNDDQYGYELLYKHYFKFMFSAAFSVLKNEENSKEVIQNTIIKIMTINKVNLPRQGESSWLYTVVKNEALMLVRKDKRNVNLDEFPEIEIFNKDIEHFMDMESYYSMIEGLNERQKEVVTLKVLGDLSHREIAAALNKPIGTIQWIYNTSIKQLRLTLVSMSSLLVIIAVGISYRSIQLANRPQVQAINTMRTIDSSNNSMIPDFTLLVLSVLFVFILCATILFYFKPDLIVRNKKKRDSK